MRLAVIADMHGNSHALEAILADAERVGVDAIAFLGDFVSDCADPEGVLALAREAAAPIPAGPCAATARNIRFAMPKDRKPGARIRAQARFCIPRSG